MSANTGLDEKGNLKDRYLNPQAWIDNLEAQLQALTDLLVANNAVDAHDLGGVIDSMQRTITAQAAQLEQAYIMISKAKYFIDPTMCDAWLVAVHATSEEEHGNEVSNDTPPLFISKAMYSVDDELDYGCQWSGHEPEAEEATK